MRVAYLVFGFVLKILLSLGLAPHAFGQVTLSKTICLDDGASSCTPVGSPQIGTPVSYVITIDNSGQLANIFQIEEDLPTVFTPADALNLMSCTDSLGNSVSHSVVSNAPWVLDVSLPDFEIVTCTIDGLFNTPGQPAINTVSSTADPSISDSVNTAIAPQAVLPVDLMITKTSSSNGTLMLADPNGNSTPQQVTYTITVTTDGDVYLDDYFKIYDQLGLFNNSIPINATLIPSSVICSTTASGGGGLSCPVTNDLSGTIVMSPWQSFVSFGYGASGPILMKAGDTLTLSYTVEYSALDGQMCVIAPDSDGVNNRAFLGLSDDSTNISDLDLSNNSTESAGLNPIPMDMNITTIDPDCIPGAGPPSPLSVTKKFQRWEPGSNSGTVPWTQDEVLYTLEIENGSATDTLYNIELTDIYQNLPHTPNHEVTLQNVDFTICPSGASCTVTSSTGWPAPSPIGATQSIQSYVATAKLWEGLISEIAPGEKVRINVTLQLRNATCDFAGQQLPKRARNHFFAEHEYPGIDPFTGDPIMIPATSWDADDITLDLTPACQIDTRKTVVSSPNEISFGVPHLYKIEFENGPDPLDAGTLLDVLRIEQQYYALEMDVSYQWSCTEFPTGSVIGFTSSGSGNGEVSYAAQPHAGLVIMDHGGFVRFAPFAKLSCDVEVIVSKPAQSDPYCYSNGVPTLGNAAIIDGSLFYSGSLAWPPTSEGESWDGVSSELPKCYHLVVNKDVSPGVTTPNFGPDLVYTVSITNGSGSPSPEGDISFPPGPVPAGSAPWNGPVITDVFHPTNFPTVLPSNAPVPGSDPCAGSGSHPCDWIEDLSNTGHEIGISKLLAGGTISYTYSIPGDYDLHQICNDISGELLIGGAPSDRWYVKYEQLTKTENVCALIRTNLRIDKTVNAHPTISLPGGNLFTVDIDCTPPSGFSPVPMSQSFPGSGGSQTQGRIIVGSTCIITEQTPDESYLPSHCDWDAPVYPDGQTVLADGSVEPHVLSVENNMTCRFGDLEVSKTVTGNMPAIAPSNVFTVDVSCTSPSNQSYNFSINGNGLQTLEDIPAGSVCTVTEQQPQQELIGNYLCTWDAPSYTSSQSVTITDGGVAQVNIANSFDCVEVIPDAKLRLNKVLLAAAGTPLPTGTYDMEVSCTDGSAHLVSLSANSPQAVSLGTLPIGTYCTVTELGPDPAMLGAGCSWNAPSYQPGQTVIIPDDGEAQVSVINTLYCPPTGLIRVNKIINPNSDPQASSMSYDYDLTCTDAAGNVSTTPHSVAAGQTEVHFGPTSTNCVVTENLPPAPANCNWSPAQYPLGNSANFTTHTGRQIDIVNMLACTPPPPMGTLRFEKVIAPDSAPVPPGTLFDISVSCNGAGQPSGIYPVEAGVLTTLSGAVSGICLIEEKVLPPAPEGCEWADPIFRNKYFAAQGGMQTGFSVSPNALMTQIENKLICVEPDPDPAILEIEKTLIGTEPCFDPVTGEFNCQFEITLTNTGGTPVSGPFTVLDELASSYAYIPPLTASNGWTCTPPAAPPIPAVSPVSCVSPSSVTINPGASTSFTIDMHAYAVYPPTENCASIDNLAGEIVESCAPLNAPDLEISKVLLNPECAVSSPLACQFEITITNNGSSDYSGQIFVQEEAFSGGPNGNSQSSTISVIPPTNGWQCSFYGPPNNGGWPGGHPCYNTNVNIGANGGTSSFTVEMTAWNNWQFDIPYNCVSLLYSNSEEEYCIPLENPNPTANLDITKEKLTPGNCRMNSPLGAYLCEYKITITNNGPSGFNGPISFDDLIYTNNPPLGQTPGTISVQPTAVMQPGGFVQPTGSWTCTDYPANMGFACESAGAVNLGVGDSVELTLTVDHSSTRFDQNCAILEEPAQTPKAESCVWTHDLHIEKVKLTPGDCMGMGPSPQPCEFQIIITNIGATLFDDYITIEDIVTGGGGMPVIANDPAWDCPQTSASVLCTSLSKIPLNSGQSTTLTITLDMANPTYVIENCATLVGPEVTPEPTHCIPLEDVTPADFTITKEPHGVCANAICAYEITVTNNGGNYTGPLHIDDVFTQIGGSVPYHVSTSSIDGWNCLPLGTAPDFDCDVTSINLPNGGSTTFIMSFDLQPGAAYENCASIENPATGQVIEDCHLIPAMPTGPSLTKTLDGPCINGVCSYTITLTNNGPNIANGPHFVGENFTMTGSGVPTFTGVTSQDGWVCNVNPQNAGGGLNCYLSNIPLGVGQSSSFTVTFDMNGSGNYENCASTPLGSNQLPLIVCVDHIIGSTAVLSIEKTKITPGDCHTGPTGNECEFEIVITNNGPGDYSGPLSFDDEFDWGVPNLTGPSTPVSWSPPTPWNCYSTPTGTRCDHPGVLLTPGQTETLNVILDHGSLNGAFPIENCAILTDPAQTPEPEACVPIEYGTPELQITKSVVGAQYCSSGSCTFEITVTNIGNGTYSGPLNIDDTIIYSMIPNFQPSFVSNTGDFTCGPAGGSFKCLSNANVNIAPGDNESFTITLNLDPTLVADENCATLNQAAPLQDLTSCIDLHDLPQTESVLDIQKEIDPAAPCDPVNGCQFIITITNLGPDPFSGMVAFEDFVHVGGNPVSGTISAMTFGWSCTAGLCQGNAGIPVGGFDTVTLFLSPNGTNALTAHGANCVVLETPMQSPQPMDCVGIAMAPIDLVRVFKDIAPDSEGTYSSGGTFEFNINCGSQNFPGAVEAGESEIIAIGVPSSPCTISETAMPTPSDPNCMWDAPVFNPSDQISPTNGGITDVTVTNRMSCPALLPALSLNKELVNCSNAFCEFKITVTNIGQGDFSGDLNISDQVVYPGTNTPYTAFYMYENSSDPWQCIGSGAQFTCDWFTANLPSGQSTSVNVHMDIPSGADFENCAILQNINNAPPLRDCVLVPSTQQRLANPNGGTDVTDLTWDIGTEIAIPSGGDIITGESINNIPQTSSDNVGFDDVYEPGLGLSGGLSYPINEAWSVVGGLGYQRFKGGAASLGSINGLSLNGTMSDFERFTVDAGLRYALPETQIGNISGLRPYLEGRIGGAHTSAIVLENATLGPAGPVAGRTVPLYRPSWSPVFSGAIGVDIPVNDNVDLGAEIGLRRSGALRSDGAFFGPGQPLAGTNNSESQTDIPVKFKLRSKF